MNTQAVGVASSTFTARYSKVVEEGCPSVSVLCQSVFFEVLFSKWRAPACDGGVCVC